MKRVYTFFAILITLSCWLPIQAQGLPGPKIEGPWAWMIASTDGEGGTAAAASGKDFLERASNRAVTEQHIANNGVEVGDRVGNRVWASGELAPIGSNNISKMLNTIGLGGNRDNYVVYGSIALTGFYTDRSRAAYWDGRNVVGERVASGIYFYQLQTDNVSLLRKMLILK